MAAGSERHRHSTNAPTTGTANKLTTDGRTAAPSVTWTDYAGDRFVSAVENGPLWATQFHPEKSGDAGAAVLRSWVHSLG